MADRRAAITIRINGDEGLVTWHEPYFTKYNAINRADICQDLARTFEDERKRQLQQHHAEIQRRGRRGRGE